LLLLLVLVLSKVRVLAVQVLQGWPPQHSV
jgi:hypothetical protein